MIAIDTNLLVYAHRSDSRWHEAAKRAIERAAAQSSGWGIALASVSEFWRVVTSSAFDSPTEPAMARDFIQALLESGQGTIWQPKLNFFTRLGDAAVALHVRGARMFDLQIALTAIEHGAAEVWTHDKDFVRFPGLRVVDPLQA